MFDQLTPLKKPEAYLAPSTAATTFSAKLESSLRDHATLWMYGLLGLGFVTRLFRASTTYLNPDEAMHFMAANRPTWAQAEASMASLFHPPLLILILRIWRHLGTSELMLRTPSILAGLAFCWFGFKWMRMLLPQSIAWIGYLFLLFLPSSIDLSTEIRQYALLLAFGTGSAYFLERAFREHSPKLLLVSCIFLLFAISSHYSSFLLAAALGGYAMIRIRAEKPSWTFISAWVVTQLLAFALCCAFYFFHISHLRQYYPNLNATHGWMENDYLGNSYFDPAKSNPLVFAAARTGGVFQYAMGQGAVGDLAFVLALVAAVVILRRPNVAAISRWPLIALLALPFAVNCAAAFGRFYPYGGTRHSAFLLPFAFVATSIGIAFVCRFRAVAGAAVALSAVLVCSIFPTRAKSYIPPASEKRETMAQAMSFTQQKIAPGDIIFSDLQTGLLLQYYLCEARPVMPAQAQNFVSFNCGGRQVIAARIFAFTPETFVEQWNRFVQSYRLSPEQRVWVTQMGWSRVLASDIKLASGSPINSVSVGNKIQFFPLDAGQKMADSAALPAS